MLDGDGTTTLKSAGGSTISRQDFERILLKKVELVVDPPLNIQGADWPMKLEKKRGGDPLK